MVWDGLTFRSYALDASINHAPTPDAVRPTSWTLILNAHVNLEYRRPLVKGYCWGMGFQPTQRINYLRPISQA